MLRPIRKWLKAGVPEDGEWPETNVGTPQGAVISPLLANVYLHWLRPVVNGYIRYFAVPGNLRAEASFRRGVARSGCGRCGGGARNGA